MPGYRAAMRMRIAVLALAALALGGKAEAAGPPPLRVLFVGNSLTATNDLPRLWVSAKRAHVLQAAAAEAVRRT
jgi:hypothetical protein